jgi:hypothetical protein
MSIQTANSPNPVSAKLTNKPKAAVPTAPKGPHQKRKTVPEEAIRLHAYQKWEAAGKPVDDSLRFWFEAQRELSHGK